MDSGGIGGGARVFLREWKVRTWYMGQRRQERKIGREGERRNGRGGSK